MRRYLLLISLVNNICIIIHIHECKCIHLHTYTFTFVYIQRATVCRQIKAQVSDDWNWNLAVARVAVILQCNKLKFCRIVTIWMTIFSKKSWLRIGFLIKINELLYIPWIKSFLMWSQCTYLSRLVFLIFLIWKVLFWFDESRKSTSKMWTPSFEM